MYMQVLNTGKSRLDSGQGPYYDGPPPVIRLLRMTNQKTNMLGRSALLTADLWLATAFAIQQVVVRLVQRSHLVQLHFSQVLEVCYLQSGRFL